MQKPSDSEFYMLGSCDYFKCTELHIMLMRKEEIHIEMCWFSLIWT